jgi:hypothetical protein
MMMMQEMERLIDQKEEMRITERRGRIKAEKVSFSSMALMEREEETRIYSCAFPILNQELRKLINEKLDTSKGHFIQPIGKVCSCFRKCLGNNPVLRCFLSLV